MAFDNRSTKIDYMPAVLRVSGPFERLRLSLGESSLPFEESIASTRNREGKSVDAISTFNLTVSEADGDKVPTQISDAEKFIASNTEGLRWLSSCDGVQHLCLDFSWDIPKESIGQWNRFPSSLLQLCAQFNLDIEISVYRDD